jgi:hypothetical protein
VSAIDPSDEHLAYARIRPGVKVGFSPAARAHRCLAIRPAAGPLENSTDCSDKKSPRGLSLAKAEGRELVKEAKGLK